MKSSGYNCLLFACLLLLAFCFLIACAPNIPGNSSPSPKTATVAPEKTSPAPVEGTVTDVMDNNIIKVNITGTTHTVRYIGIDTLVPYRPGKPLEYYVEECQKKNHELVKGRAVRLEKDVSEADKSGYLLRYVWVGDMMANAELVRQGYATAWGSPPDIKYYDVLAKLHLEARSEGRGLWPEEKERWDKIRTQPEFWGVSISSTDPAYSNVPRFYHYPSCKLLVGVRHDTIVMFRSVEEARANRYTPCNVCRPN
jgi:endonuclease YncB( thermonuclease family)